MNASTKSTDRNRPVVVLLGWLGCQPKHINRYRRIYESIGWDSLVRIGNPRSVIAAVIEGPHSRAGTPLQSEMRHLAIDILQNLQAIQPPQFAIHAFSNNGCFLWEWIRYILFDRGPSQQLPAKFNLDIHNLRQRLVGVVFDSGPAFYDGNVGALRSALQHVSSPTERSRLLEQSDSIDANLAEQRFSEFWKGLCNDSTGTPQLYLFSQIDKLASANHLEKLIACRRRILGKDAIWKHKFVDSNHCSHLLKYSDEYEQLVKQFISFCCGQCNCARSKL